MRKRTVKRPSVDTGSAANSAHNPTFLVHGVNVTALPPSFRKDGGRKRFSPTATVPPPTGLSVPPRIAIRVPPRKRKHWWQ